MHPTTSRSISHARTLRASTLAALALAAGGGAGIGAGAAQAQCVTSFVQPVSGYPSTTGFPGSYRVVARDLNGDGRLDLVTINPQSHRVIVRLGMAGGAFGPESENYAGQSTPLALAFADVNGDGRPDLIGGYLGGGGSVAVRMGNGDGTFGPAVAQILGSSMSVMAAADFNGDGRADLVQGGNNIRLGNGDGTFGPTNAFSVPGGVSAVLTADFNGDGKPDIASAVGAGNAVSVQLNNHPGGGGVPSLAAAVSYPVGTNPQTITAADVNGDGRLDLITGNRTAGTVSVLLGNGNGTFANAPGGAFFAGTGADSVAVADFNGDGKVDLVVSNFGLGAVSVLPGTGNGAFGSPVGFAIPVCEMVVAGDFTGDGRNDVIGASMPPFSDHFWMLQNNSPGAPAPTFTLQPVGQVIATGATVNLTANVSNAQSYQWRRNGAPISDGDLIWGAATNTLTITQASASDMAVYDLRASSVSCTGVTNSVVSTPVVLGVTPPPPSNIPANNACSAAMRIGNGTHLFSTVNATTDGPAEPNLGFCCDDPQINRDVWFIYTASCSGPAAISLCGSSFDTKVAVYNGAACPAGPGAAMAGNDDNGVCGANSLQSSVTFTAVAGREYLIRVGGFQTAAGNVAMSVSCNGSGCLLADIGVQGGGFGRDGALDNNDFVAFIEAFFSHTGCP